MNQPVQLKSDLHQHGRILLDGTSSWAHGINDPCAVTHNLEGDIVILSAHEVSIQGDGGEMAFGVEVNMKLGHVRCLSKARMKKKTRLIYLLC